MTEERDFNGIAEDELEFLANVIFEYLNGKINPTIAASGITVSQPRMHSYLGKGNGDVIVGIQIGNRVHVNLNYINDYDDQIKEQYGNNNTVNPSWYTSVLFEIIAHELSHIEQDLDYIRYALDPKYHDFIEVTNVKRTFKWLKDHTREIKRYFPDFDPETSMRNNGYANNKKLYAKHSVNEYVHRQTYNDAFIAQLDYLTQHDTKSVFLAAMKNGFKRFGFIDYDSLDSDICIAGTIKDILTNEYIAKTALTYITEKIIGDYGKFVLNWTMDTASEVLTLQYRRFGDIYHGNDYTSYTAVYVNEWEEELKFIQQYHDNRFEYAGKIIAS